ncbi:hypothetical protein ZIOFF_063004 [Zingiber officinale]|uniref:Uncharacterized protein n=1 Tax=Zingiber officinale TaxID=94328 RepID=A0A8J5F1L8_ZINOF|nr:hypothetical protein ZIOFF_063004 [Zingiber officinale]
MTPTQKRLLGSSYLDPIRSFSLSPPPPTPRSSAGSLPPLRHPGAMAMASSHLAERSLTPGGDASAANVLEPQLAESASCFTFVRCNVGA